jgi:hypothetical protein
MFAKTDTTCCNRVATRNAENPTLDAASRYRIYTVLFTRPCSMCSCESPLDDARIAGVTARAAVPKLFRRLNFSDRNSPSSAVELPSEDGVIVVPLSARGVCVPFLLNGVETPEWLPLPPCSLLYPALVRKPSLT